MAPFFLVYHVFQIRNVGGIRPEHLLQILVAKPEFHGHRENIDHLAGSSVIKNKRRMVTIEQCWVDSAGIRPYRREKKTHQHDELSHLHPPYVKTIGIILL